MYGADVYSEPVTYILPNCVAKVFTPILTEEERERRMRRISDAAAKLLMSAEETKKKVN